MELQTKSLEDRVTVHMAAEHMLELELQEERRRRCELETFLDSVDVEKLRRDCRELELAKPVKSTELRRAKPMKNCNSYERAGQLSQ